MEMVLGEIGEFLNFDWNNTLETSAPFHCWLVCCTNPRKAKSAQANRQQTGSRQAGTSKHVQEMKCNVSLPFVTYHYHCCATINEIQLTRHFERHGLGLQETKHTC